MRRAYFILLFILVFYGCGIFQNTETGTLRSALKSEEESVKNAELNASHQSVGWSMSLSDDSLNSSSTVVIWPKGEFTYSPSTGFWGTAEKVVLTETSKSGRKILEEQVKLEEVNKRVLVHEQQVKTVSADQKERVRVTKSQWWILLLIPVLLLLFWGLRNVWKLRVYV
ncbi:hypothetical protein [Pedobacter gandavensis]|uniref:Lipoprotein n=1 Tax=Pedobacter gandavensis TaxID=2679963 RepID=A0ABR6EZ36_9SPHI|nr:hypothetical protein [Pedobacter gandavensis]MBB2150542.1 hypothetical protein [Pedobacter gandavensis]